MTLAEILQNLDSCDPGAHIVAAEPWTLTSESRVVSDQQLVATHFEAMPKLTAIATALARRADWQLENGHQEGFADDLLDYALGEHAWAAIEARNYNRALKLHAELAELYPSPWTLKSRALSELCCGRFTQARSTYERIHETVKRSTESARFWIALASWCEGHADAAIETVKTELTAIEDGQTRILEDFGLREGTLCYYFGAAVNSCEVMVRGREFLTRRIGDANRFCWPPGVREFLIDELTLAEAQMRVESKAIDARATDAASNLQRERAQVKLAFCAAVKTHERVGRTAALPLYGRLVGRHDVVLPEWHLARWETREGP